MTVDSRGSSREERLLAQILEELKEHTKLLEQIAADNSASPA